MRFRSSLQSHPLWVITIDSAKCNAWHFNTDTDPDPPFKNLICDDVKLFRFFGVTF